MSVCLSFVYAHHIVTQKVLGKLVDIVCSGQLLGIL